MKMQCWKPAMEVMKVRQVVGLEMMHRRLYVCLQVHLRRAEEQASHPGHPPAAVPEGSRRDLGSQGGSSLLIYKHTHTHTGCTLAADL